MVEGGGKLEQGCQGTASKDIACARVALKAMGAVVARTRTAAPESTMLLKLRVKVPPVAVQLSSWTFSKEKTKMMIRHEIVTLQR